ncbi:DUF4417 domain-containing protein [Sphingomonas koreensis]|uniref:DUF4417 domain-containing protein n=1 Tax=Sphingomonas koreensis TaxID=93064 RepID=A0A430G476_9SPHN|nr:DUF4417 domain-containing protein [Sphingomonas koreensis]RSY85969.1 DUF4417 domain-containing protein [Sphingomonas koreensis]
MKSQTSPSVPKSFRNPQSLWDDAARSPTALGCTNCVDKDICGGAHRAPGFFDCEGYCNCLDKASCDLVCRGNPASFVERLREIGGLSLGNAPRAPLNPVAPLPAMIPLIEHKSARQRRLNFPIVALRLHKLIDFDKRVLRFTNREALATQYGIDPNARLIVSGVGRDTKIERYWGLSNREEILAELQQIGITLITTPNFSVLSDVPRTDNLHAMKRILLTYGEMASAGLPVALHLNARTGRDYERWAEIIAEREEIQCVTFEFATGAGRGSRIDWHVEHLQKLAAAVGRPLRLILRGGNRVLEELRQSFDAVSMLDTDAFNRTRCRRQAYFTESGQLVWRKHVTAKGAPIDDLLAQNVATLHSHHIYLEHLHADRRLAASVAAAAEHRNRKAS